MGRREAAWDRAGCRINFAPTSGKAATLANTEVGGALTLAIVEAQHERDGGFAAPHLLGDDLATRFQADPASCFDVNCVEAAYV